MFEGAGRSLWKEGRQLGREEGREANLLENIQSLVKRLHLSTEQAMDALDIPPEEREGIRKKLLPSS